MAGKKHKVQGLRRRWLTGSMGPVLVILLLVGVLISVGFASNYYNSARSTLRAKAAAGADYFNTYVMTSYREYYRSATIYAAAFDDSDKIELQFLNSSGRVEVTTRGVTTGTYPSTPEILRALESGTVQDYIGRDSVTGERILAVSGLLKFNGQVVGVMRYVTAIGNIDRQVLLTVLLVAGVMLAVVGLIVMSSMIFINNVVAPVSAVSEAAKRISGGSYGVQIPNKYSDEMGELVDSIADYNNSANAIGFSVYYYIDQMYSKPGLRLLTVDGVTPSNDTLADGSYPLCNDFYAVIHPDAAADSPECRLYDWLDTADGIACIQKAGYVPAQSAAKAN